MCLVCDEYGKDECPCCEREPEEIEMICRTCMGDGKFYLRISDGKYIDKKEYTSLSIFDKIDIEVEDCEDCEGTGYKTIKKLTK